MGASPLVLAATFDQEQAVWADRVEGINGIDIVGGQGAVRHARSSLPGEVVTADQVATVKLK